MATPQRRSRGRLRGVGSPRRWVAVLVLLGVGVLYYRPLAAYVGARDAVARRTAEVAQLRAQKRTLERRVRAEASPKALEREARRLAYVKPGERLFLVKGVSQWKRDRARERARAAARLGGDG
jgi:cell division protein FtsB